jgi:hypothetical protein
VSPKDETDAPQYRSNHKRPNTQFMSPVTWGPLRYEPHQAQGERFLDRATVKGLLLRGMERDHPRAVGLVDVPGARAAAGGQAPVNSARTEVTRARCQDQQPRCTSSSRLTDPHRPDQRNSGPAITACVRRTERPGERVADAGPRTAKRCLPCRLGFSMNPAGRSGRCRRSRLLPGRAPPKEPPPQQVQYQCADPPNVLNCGVPHPRLGLLHLE